MRASGASAAPTMVVSNLRTLAAGVSRAPSLIFSHWDPISTSEIRGQGIVPSRNRPES